jgi:hypothetical protein
VSGGWDPPSSPGSTPPPPLNAPPPPPGYHAPPGYPYQALPPEPRDGKATASLVLGIAGLALLVTSTGLLAPVTLVLSILAWVFGSGRDGQARAGRICGMVGVGLAILAMLFWAAIIVVAATSGDNSSG